MEQAPQTDTHIWGIFAREILDSRGNPTIEVTVILNSGYRGTASVPSGASVGKYEAGELRDKDAARYGGMGVLTAVRNVAVEIAGKLKGLDASDQSTIDRTMIELDGTPNKTRLGANSILGVSLACAVAVANARRMPLYRYLNAVFSAYMPVTIQRIPTPIFNVINGGKHGAGNLNFQEFQIIPASGKPFFEALRSGVELYHAIKQTLIYRNAVSSVGDEGGFAPNLFTNIDAIEIITDVIRQSRYRFGVDMFLGLDLAASTFKTDRGYEIKDRPNPLSTGDFIQYLKDLHAKYRLLILEDAIDQDDWAGWAQLTTAVGSEILVVGDDLLVSNESRLRQAINQKACSAILLKPNQIGTLSQLLSTIHLAKKNDIRCIMSHRSGETNDSFIADLAVGIQADYVKFGAPARGERVAKYNRLLEIEAELAALSRTQAAKA